MILLLDLVSHLQSLIDTSGCSTGDSSTEQACKKHHPHELRLQYTSLSSLEFHRYHDAPLSLGQQHRRDLQETSSIGTKFKAVLKMFDIISTFIQQSHFQRFRCQWKLHMLDTEAPNWPVPDTATECTIVAIVQYTAIK